jgi:hypothetical protein
VARDEENTPKTGEKKKKKKKERHKRRADRIGAVMSAVRRD